MPLVEVEWVLARAQTQKKAQRQARVRLQEEQQQPETSQQAQCQGGLKPNPGARVPLLPGPGPPCPRGGATWERTPFWGALGPLNSAPGQGLQRGQQLMGRGEREGEPRQETEEGRASRARGRGGRVLRERARGGAWAWDREGAQGPKVVQGWGEGGQGRKGLGRCTCSAVLPAPPCTRP